MTRESDHTDPHATAPGADGRESLSALFDGELQGDAARFVHKRLDHDAGWRQACGRWQLAGDVLRGQVAAVAPDGFADRIATAVADEPVNVQPAASNAVASRFGRRARRGWIPGAALAASMALVALFVVDPFADPAAPPGSTATQQTAATAPPAAAENDGVDPAQVASGTAAALAAAAAAIVDVPRRDGERRSRGQLQPGAVRGREGDSPAVAAVDASPAAPDATPGRPDAVADTAVATRVSPFRPPPAEQESRPWPRTTLPNQRQGAMMTAGFGAGAGARSFYPFEPSMPVPVQPPPRAPAPAEPPVQPADAPPQPF